MVDEERARPAQVIVVLGARVYPDGHLSHALADRLETALRLYRAGRAPTVLVSGADDEPGAMRRWLEARGVPPTAIVEDAGGVDTYSTMARASGTYGAATAIVVTQAFHLPRALYLGARKGVACEGVVADARRYQKAPYYQLREVFSRVRKDGRNEWVELGVYDTGGGITKSTNRTNRPEYKTTLAEHKRDKKPPGALAFFTEGAVDKQSFEKFLNLFSGTTTDPRQNHFTIMADAFRQAAISIAWSLVPYVETRFRTLERVYGPTIKNKNSPQYGHRAGGVFQFMPSTALRYGLSEEDRFDMTKAAPAAAKFMSRLENHQGDFLLAVASYNRGEGGIDQDTAQAESALVAAQSKGSFNHDAIKDFTSDWWKILHFNMAPKETQYYVIRVVSGIIFGMNPQKHGLASQPITIE